MCRRCGAPLHPDESNRIALPATLTRRATVATAAAPTTPIATAAAAAGAPAAFRESPSDTLIPGAMPRPDNLLPRPARAKAAPARVQHHVHAPADTVTRAASMGRSHWRHILVLAIVAVALTTSLVAVWPVVFRANSSSPASSAVADARASGLLRTVVAGGRTLFAPHRSFAGLSPAQLSARSYHVPVVASTAVARAGAVSMSVTSAATLTLATPATADRCVFARDEPATPGTEFVTVATRDCRAAAAPAQGWKSS